MTLKRKLLLALNIGGVLSLLVVSIVFGIKHDASEKSIVALNVELNTYQSANSALSETVDNYTQEIFYLKQDIAAAQQYAEDWKSYAENLSAEVIYVPEYHEQTIVQKEAQTPDVIYVPEYHEQTIVKEVEVDKPVYVNNEWREYESPAELMSWAQEHLAYLWIIGDQVADCDDYASRLQLEAYKDGYLFSVQLIQNGMLFGKNVSNYLQSHMGNLAMIGNEIYFVEPQPDYFRIVFVCNRD